MSGHFFARRLINKNGSFCICRFRSMRPSENVNEVGGGWGGGSSFHLLRGVPTLMTPGEMWCMIQQQNF